MSVRSGQKALASVYNADVLVGQCVGHAERATNSSTTTTTEIGVLRLDNIPIVTGWRYLISISPLIFNSTVASDLVAANLKGNTAGTAVVGSTQITGINEASYSAGGNQRTKGATVTYPAVVTGMLSLLLTVVRASGTGTVGLNASATYPMQIDVLALGVDPGDTGVDL